MSDNPMTPELILTTDPAGTAAAAAPATPQLTLDPAATMDDAAAAQKARDEHAVKLDESQLSESERKMVEDFSKQINIRDSNVVFQYGAAAQKNIVSFSENALTNVRTKDLGAIGEDLSALVVELKTFGEPEKSGIFGFFQRKKKELMALRAQYEKAEGNVDKIAAMLDQMYELNTK